MAPELDYSILNHFMTYTISTAHNDALVAIPDAEEIRTAIFSMDSDSSPGLDGFGGVFYQYCWEVIASDVIEVVRHFFLTLVIPDGVNSSLVALLPKSAVALRVEEYRPIVMGNYLFKIFTKIQATRLGCFIGENLSPFQFGFISGHRIHSCIVLTSDAVKCMELGDSKNMAIKVDITKAFDTISWHFLRAILTRMGFSPRFVSMVESILCSSRLSIMINGSSQGYFGCSRGVRQGDPLSQLLFCVAEDALARWMDFAVVSGNIDVNPRLPSYLLYADDIIFFMKATQKNIRNFHRILEQYGQLAGQVYNPPKSRAFYGSKVNRLIKSYRLRTTGIVAGTLPFTYLGVPIFHGIPRVIHLQDIADSVIAKFGRWKGGYLSLVGRRCLINSVIASSLVHSMMVYRWPESLITRIEKATRNFVWTGDVNKKGGMRISWA